MWENTKEAQEALDKANAENTIVCPSCGKLDQVEIFGADAMVCHTCKKKVYGTLEKANKRIAELEAQKESEEMTNLSSITLHLAAHLGDATVPEGKRWFTFQGMFLKEGMKRVDQVRDNKGRTPTLLHQGVVVSIGGHIFEVDAPLYEEGVCPYVLDTCVVEDKEALIVETFYYVKDVRDDAMMSGLYRIQDNAAKRRLTLEKYWEMQNDK